MTKRRRRRHGSQQFGVVFLDFDGFAVRFLYTLFWAGLDSHFICHVILPIIVQGKLQISSLFEKDYTKV